MECAHHCSWPWVPSMPGVRSATSLRSSRPLLETLFSPDSVCRRRPLPPSRPRGTMVVRMLFFCSTHHILSVEIPSGWVGLKGPAGYWNVAQKLSGEGAGEAGVVIDTAGVQPEWLETESLRSRAGDGERNRSASGRHAADVGWLPGRRVEGEGQYAAGVDSWAMYGIGNPARRIYLDAIGPGGG